MTKQLLQVLFLLQTRTDQIVITSQDSNLILLHLTLFSQGNLAFLRTCPFSAAASSHSFWYQKILLVQVLLMKINEVNLPFLQHYVLFFPSNFLPSHLQSCLFTSSSCFTNKCNLQNYFCPDNQLNLKRKY